MKRWITVNGTILVLFFPPIGDGVAEEEEVSRMLGHLREPIQPYPSTFFEGCEALKKEMKEEREIVIDVSRHLVGSSETVLRIAPVGKAFHVYMRKRDESTGEVVFHEKALDSWNFVWLNMAFRRIMERPLMDVDPIRTGKVGDRYYSYWHHEYPQKIGVSESPNSAFLRRLEHLVDLMILSLCTENEEDAWNLQSDARGEAADLWSELVTDADEDLH